jgi:two-component system, cell cycle response regulator CpdR
MARILLADDDKSTRDLVRRALEMDGHHVHVAEDGSDAWAAFTAAPTTFDLVVTDVEMPGTDGVTLARDVLGASPNVRVLLMSGFNEALDRGRDLGPARLGVLPKPFTLDQIRKSIKGVLEG